MTHPDSPLNTLVGAYFHQDWIIEGPDASSVIERFARDSEPAELLTARDEVRALLGSGLSERGLEKKLRQMGLNYLPEPDGMTYRMWLEFVADKLAALADKGDDQTEG